MTSKKCVPKIHIMVVNITKTEYMIYGKPMKIDLFLNGNVIEKVDSYKSLGTVLSSIATTKGDIFKNNTDYLSQKARNAIFGIKKKLKFMGHLPPMHMFYLYESMIEPILLYGSDLWGSFKDCTKDINKIYLWFIRIVLNIKATTCNVITMGESGIIPPEVKCHINSILYFIRLNSLPNGSVVKSVFNELQKLHLLGCQNWYSQILELSDKYGIKSTFLNFSESTKKTVKSIIKSHFINTWKSDVSNLDKYPSLRTYTMIKTQFICEPYLKHIKKQKYLIAFSRFRASSHILEIERGRYTNPRTPRDQRLCALCKEIEDEQHFLINCKMYEKDRYTLFQKITNIHSDFHNFSLEEKFIFMMNNEIPTILTWVAKFIHDSMLKRVQIQLDRD